MNMVLHPLAEKAYHFATYCHRKQTRKYTGEPYIEHCKEVAGLVIDHGGIPEMVAAAFLHDVIEDCEVTEQLLTMLFGDTVSLYVVGLSDVTTLADGNRAKRKAIERDRLANSFPSIQTVKVADLISNARSICVHDPDFAKVFMVEMEELLMVLTLASPALVNIAHNLLIDYRGLSRRL